PLPPPFPTRRSSDLWFNCPTTAPAPERSSVTNITCELRGPVETTRPTTPPGVTTGILTSTPAQRPLSIVMPPNHIDKGRWAGVRSEEHTSELQSLRH